MKIRVLQLFSVFIIASGIIIFTFYVQAESSFEEVETLPSFVVLENEQNDLNPEELYSNWVSVFQQEGIATWYGKNFHNRKTASGERYNMYSYTAAHKTLPFGTIVRVINISNNQSILLRINDRGPFPKKRIIDLSVKAKNELNACGTEQVRVETIIPKPTFGELNDYIVAFSFEHPPFLIKKANINVIDSSSNFDEAIELYLRSKELSDNKAQELIIFADNYYPKKRENITYYIAYCDPLMKILPPQKALTRLN